MIKFFVILILFAVCCSSQSCSNYYQDERACIQSQGISCIWNNFSNKCTESRGTKLGCLKVLNLQACISQTQYPDQSIAACIFSGYCRKVEYDQIDCLSNLSRSACLGVSAVYCKWSTGVCQRISDISIITSTQEMELSSIGVCQNIKGFPAIHQQGAHSALYALYTKNLMGTNVISVYEKQLSIPGCFQPDEEVYKYIECNAEGLNAAGCIKVVNGFCKFEGSSCQKISDFSKLKCNDQLNQNACLSITNFSETCYWNGQQCSTFRVTSTTSCLVGIQVSPSVCANIVKEECFYVESLRTCDGKCRSQINLTKQTACLASKFGCSFDLELKCTFADGQQCNRLGQNKLACLNANQLCRFSNGICQSIDNLNLLGCASGLNKKACINLTNPSQVCNFQDECKTIYITPENRCNEVFTVNANACSKITTGGCYWDQGNCYSSVGDEQCTVFGLNRIACLSTTNTLSPCQWNGQSGQCVSIQVKKEITCDSLKMVNAVACRNVTFKEPLAYQLCKYNQITYSCEKFTMNTSILCTTAGLNAQGCQEISDVTQSCRWSGTQCVSVQSLGTAVSCQSLQGVTAKTCAMIQTGTQKCKYDYNRNSCSTSVISDDKCDTQGLNPAGCASVSSSCYFSTTNDICLTAGESDYKVIKCESNWPSKKACLNISTNEQYCKWNSTSTICELQIFPVSNACAKYTNVNKLFCLAYEVSTSRYISKLNYCTYDSATYSCKILDESAWTDCGTKDANMHACVALSDPTKYCYFEQTTLKCSEITSTTDPKFGSISCKVANKKVCTDITTPKQYCQWTENQKKCETIKTGSLCSTYRSVPINSNVCASAKADTACIYDELSKFCVELGENLYYSCTTLGLNLKACIQNTNQPCYFDDTTQKCAKVTDQIARKLSCTEKLNKLGCVSLLKEYCYWDDKKKVCYTVTKIDFNKITCAELGDTNNMLSCAAVTTPGEICGYQNGCYSLVSQYNNACFVGYNKAACQGSAGNCSEWNDSTKICAYKTAAQAVSVSDYCYNKTTKVECLSITSVNCGWYYDQCVQFTVQSYYPTCDQLTATAGNSFNAYLCQQIQAFDSYCQYDETNKACKTVTVDNLNCNTIGLNKRACVLKTKGKKCVFNDDITSSNYGCQEILDFSNQLCSSLNAEACVSVTQDICTFHYIDKQCVSRSKYWVAIFECKDFANKDEQTVTSNLCQYVKGENGCVYDNTNKCCQISNAKVTYCDNLPPLNAGNCNNNVTSQICKYDIEQGCFAFDSYNALCNQCNTFKQCVNSAQQPCVWNISQCEIVNSSISCTSLINVNAQACMSVENEKCQFQDSGSSTSCITPPDDTQLCPGLNKTACLANTAYGCYFVNKSCNNITLNPYVVKCDGSVQFTYAGCMGIKTPGQLCIWQDNACQTSTVNESDTCSTYPSNINSGLICASIKTGNCYWNNGCVSGLAPNCQTLGANKGACVGALSGNCIFSQNVCIDVDNPTPIIFNYCNEPSNMGGCLNLNNGLPCSWNGSMCDYITVTAGCATYSNVGPGVCAQTIDVACKWVTNACQAMTVKGSCTDKGLNKKACIGFTNGLCYYDKDLNLCQKIDDITKRNCTDNLNQNACLGHTSKCCKWFNNTCIDSSSGSDCSSLSMNSNYCCVNLSGDKCTYTNTCAKLSNKLVRCEYAINNEACMWVQSSCRWDLTYQQCVEVPTNYGCQEKINGYACSQQQVHCKYLNNKCVSANVNDTCTDLKQSSLSSTQCKLINTERCVADTLGCTVNVDSNPACSDNINKIACLYNANNCTWNNTTHECSKFDLISVLPKCSTNTLISTGVCSSSSQNCYLDTNFTCLQLSDIYSNTITCDQRNSVTKLQSDQCTSIPKSICQYNEILQTCQSKIFGTKCEVTITEYGCAYIQNNCYWDNDQCKTYDSAIQFYKCESIFAKFKCLKNVATSCIWDSNNHKCLTYSGNMKPCEEYTDDLTSPGICYYYSTDFCTHNGSKCQKEYSQTVCENSKSPLGCQANTSGNCYWDLYVGKCITLTDTSLASSMTCPLFKYSNKQFCMAPTGEGQTCVWKDNLCQSANFQEVKCNSDLAINGCRAVALQGEQCIFTTKCGYSDNTITNCTDALNIYACFAVLKDGQYCKWLGQKCSSLQDEDGYLMSTHILVNANSCRKTYTMNGIPDGKLAHIGVKYDSINYVCQPSDNSSDLCSTPGLNYYGCLNTQADACVWNGSKCVSFNFNVSYNSCQEYKSVSPKVCASINQGKLMCQHNSSTLSCENFTEEQDIFVGDQYINSKQGMNRLACINVKKQPTIWINGYCYYNQVKPAITTCGQLVDVNAKSCAQIDKEDIICKYDSDGKCTTLFDGTIDNCTTAGLNKLGCIQVENVLCQFINGQCQYYDIQIKKDCSSVTNVNALVCTKISNQPCKFSYINRGCVDVFQDDKCTATGINKQGCNQQSSCSWINSHCFCKALVQSQGLIDCSVYAVKQCIQSQCIVDNEICRNINCNDIVADKCNSTNFGPVKCYLNKSICQTALKCNDLFNVTCTQYSFNGISCVSDPWNKNHCVNKSCSTLTTLDQCSGDCTWSESGCSIKECQYMKKEQCSGIMNGKQCYWDGYFCQPLSTCQELMFYQTQQTQAICESQTVLNKQCYWKKNKPYSSDSICTSSICYDKGNSKISCHGSEIQNEVCILLPDYSCVSCPEIKEACSCMAISYCYYNEKQGCQSTPCSNLSQDSCVTNSERCVYTNGSCKQICGKLSKTDCEVRATSQECHWNSDSDKCLIGPAPTKSINTIVDVVVFESSFSKILVIIIVVHML